MSAKRERKEEDFVIRYDKMNESDRREESEEGEKRRSVSVCVHICMWRVGGGGVE